MKKTRIAELLSLRAKFKSESLIEVAVTNHATEEQSIFWIDLTNDKVVTEADGDPKIDNEVKEEVNSDPGTESAAELDADKEEE